MMPTDKASHVIQIWRLSDLKLIKSIILPRPPRFADAIAKNAYEPRLLQDGKTVLVLTSGCGLYQVMNLDGDHPGARFLYDFGYRACGVPAIAGRYWIQPTSAHSLVSLDISDLSKVKEAGRLALDNDALPHWVSNETAGNRIVITGFGSLATHALFARVDPKTGALTWYPQYIDFDRHWPDGWNGPAMPHGALFSN